MKSETGVIFDLDGVLCEEFPVPVQADGKPNFKAMDSLYRIAFPIEQNCELARKCAEAGFRIIVVTARGIRTKQICASWLMEHNVPFDLLITRSTEEEIPASKVKSLAVDYIMGSLGIKEILFALDDDPDVCSMYASRGINAFRRVREY